MGKKYVSHLMRFFFENDLSKDSQFEFQQWFMNNESYREKQDAMLHIWENSDAASGKSTDKELVKLKKRIKENDRTTKKPLYVYVLRVAAILLLPIIGAFSVYFFGNDPATIVEPQLAEHFISYGERKRIILPDSSEVWLNAGSLLVYEKGFAGKTRSVYLMGEASFDIRKGTHPFIVKTKEINIEVLGTVFNVQSYMDDPYSITTLEQGKIQINANDAESEPVFLLPNEQLIFSKSSGMMEKRIVDAAKRSQWKQGFLIFQNSGLDYIMKTVERRFNVKMNYNPDNFKGRLFTVKFSPEEDLNQVLNLLRKVCGFQYIIKDNIVYITN